MGCPHPTPSEELNLHKERIIWVRRRVGGHIQADGCFGHLKTCRIMSSGTGIYQTPFPIFRKEPINSLARDFPFRSLLGQTLLFATTHRSGKRTIKKCKASSWKQLLCDKASLSFHLWQFRKTRISQGRGVRGPLGRGTHKPEVRLFAFYLLPVASSSPPPPHPHLPNYQHKHL